MGLAGARGDRSRALKEAVMRHERGAPRKGVASGRAAALVIVAAVGCSGPAPRVQVPEAAEVLAAEGKSLGEVIVEVVAQQTTVAAFREIADTPRVKIDESELMKEALAGTAEATDELGGRMQVRKLTVPSPPRGAT